MCWGFGDICYEREIKPKLYLNSTKIPKNQTKGKQQKQQKQNEMTEKTCKTTIVGCGEPNRGMGWYHATNILDGHIPCCSLSKVIEPFFLGPGGDLPGGKIFGEWKEEVEKRKGDGMVDEDIEFLGSVEELEDVGEGEVRMGVVSARTKDNAGLCRRLLEKGFFFFFFFF